VLSLLIVILFTAALAIMSLVMQHVLAAMLTGCGITGPTWPQQSICSAALTQ
jgi:hypothetical protein